jgi:hypothetical protein
VNQDLGLHGVPAPVMAYMRRGYTMGRGGLKMRRQIINPTHVQVSPSLRIHSPKPHPLEYAAFV